MTMMTAIAISRPGGPEVLVPEQVERPRAGKEQVLVKVAAAGVNRPDVMQRTGGYPPPPGAPLTPGLEIAGEVVALGEGCTGTRLAIMCARLFPAVVMRNSVWRRKRIRCLCLRE
jgi:NADPH:quinone reductase